MANLRWLLFLLRCGVRNLARTPRRTLVSMAAIAAAAAAILVFESFVQGVKTTFRSNVITSNYGHYQIFKHGFRESGEDDPESWAIGDYDELRRRIGAEVGPLAFMSRRLSFYGLISTADERSNGGVGIGIDAEEEQKFLTSAKVVAGKHLAQGPEDGIFVGAKLAEKLKIHPDDVVSVLVTTASGSVNASDLTVTGLFQTGVTEFDATMFYVRLSEAMDLTRIEGAPQILLGFDTGDERDETRFGSALENVVAAISPNLEVVHWRTLADFFDNGMGWIESQVAVFRWIVLVIASISIITVFMMSLMERLGEFGTMRAMGTPRSSITAMIFAESVIQSLIGSLLGIFCGIVVIAVGLRQGITMPPPPSMSSMFHVAFRIPWAATPETLALCTAVAGGIGIVPAIKMARVNVVTALARNI